MKLKIYNFAQYSKEWWEVRDLKMTASNGTAIGNAGIGLETYVLNLVSGYFSSAEERESYSNEHIERGIELEKYAREMYQLETGNEVKDVGFIEGGKYYGCSPDGLVGENGGIEIKCFKDSKHFHQSIKEEIEIESSYLWQIQMTLLVTGREWWDYVLYNPNFKKSLLVKRIKRDEVKIEKLRSGIKKGEILIKKIINKYLGNKTT